MTSSINSARFSPPAPGMGAARPIEDEHAASGIADLIDRGAFPLVLSVFGAAWGGSAIGGLVGSVTKNTGRGFAVGGAVAAASIGAGLIGAALSKPAAHKVDAESVALGWLPDDGDASGRHEVVRQDHQNLGELLIDAGSAQDHRRGQLQLSVRPGQSRAYHEREDAIAYARSTPGDQAVVRNDMYSANVDGERWSVSDVVVTAVTGQYEGDVSNVRPELMAAPGATPDPKARLSPSDWLASVPYGLDAIRTTRDQADVPLVEFAGSELIPAEAVQGRMGMYTRYLVGAPD